MPISVFFFFNDTATTEIYTLSLHDALPISGISAKCAGSDATAAGGWGSDHFARGGFGDVPVAVHACGGDESLPGRPFWRPHAGLPLPPSPDSAARLEDFRTGARPPLHSH